ncbi:permease-like cell division protein FtsX [Myxococcota bacterium]|nr:permease-like cell division protein FtsX [Myxococcota bacterium]
MLRHLGSAARRSLRNLAEFRFLNAVTVSVVAISLLLASTFALVLWNLTNVLDRWGKDVQITAYLAPGIDEVSTFRVKGELEALPEVEEVVYVDQRQAAEDFIRFLPEAADLLADLPQNPLPASLEVRLRPDLQDPSRIAAIAEGIRRSEFTEVDYSQEWVERLYTFLNLLKLSAVALGTLLAAASVFVIHNTIKLTVYARRQEIRVMRLVGATDGFIRAPFLLEGMVQGALGAGLALGLLYALHHGVFAYFQRHLGLAISPRIVLFLPGAWLAGFLAAGLLLGLAGSYLSLRRFLLQGDTEA